MQLNNQNSLYTQPNLVADVRGLVYEFNTDRVMKNGTNA